MNNNPNPSDPPSVPSSQLSPSTYRLLKLLLVLVVIVLLGVMASTIYLAYQANQQTEEVPIPKAPLKEISPTIVLDETEGWQIYGNKEYDFELKYPSSYYLDTTNLLDDNQIAKIATTPEFEQQVEYPILITIAILNSTDEQIKDTSNPELITLLDQYLNYSIFKEQYGSGVKGMFYGNPPVGSYDIFIPFPNNNQQGVYISATIRQSDYPNYGGNYQYRDLTKQILSTFRFLGEQNLTNENVPLIPHANLLITVVDEQGQIVEDAIIEILVEHQEFPDWNYAYSRDLNTLQDNLLPLYPPPSHIPATVSLRVVTPEGKTSDTLVIRNDEYWNAVERSTKDYVAKHTFNLREKGQVNEIEYESL